MLRFSPDGEIRYINPIVMINIVTDAATGKSWVCLLESEDEAKQILVLWEKLSRLKSGAVSARHPLKMGVSPTILCHKGLQPPTYLSYFLKVCLSENVLEEGSFLLR